VLEFNLPAAAERYADIAVALGEPRQTDALATARGGLERLRTLTRAVGIPASLKDLGVPGNAIGRMAASAMTVTRLLDRNVRPVALADAIEIYRRAM
jgi:alcohol dehydrogenase class IV